MPKAGEYRRSELPGLDVAISARYHWSVAKQLTPIPLRHRNLRNLTLQTLELFSAYSRLYNAVASPASRLRSAGSLTKMFYGYAMFIGVNSQKGSRYLSFPV